MKAVLIPVTVLCLMLQQPVWAKHPTRYGSEAGFWQAHSLVRGTIEHLEHRYGKVYHISIHVDDCVGYPIPVEGRLKAEYTEPERAENPFAGLKRGERVLALVRPSFGLATIPNGDDEGFAMMPGGEAIYPMADARDPRAEETMRIGRALTIPGLRERLDAISSIIGNQPSTGMKAFLQAYLDIVVRQTEADLTWAKALSGQVKRSRSPGDEKEGQPTNQVRGFPILPPVPTADPAVRSEKKFRVPSQLRVCRSGRYVGVEAVPGALETVKVTVGKDMVTGLRYEVSVYREGKLILSGPGGMQSGPDATYAQVAATVGEVGSKNFQPGEKYEAKLRLTLFETDIPPQHFWAPETGRYKALWSKTLSLDLRAPDDGLPVGRWNIEFANGVKEVCEVRKDRTSSVTEPARTSTAKVEINDGSVLIVFEDNRVERWTPVGKRMVVEHWHPGAPYPSGTPVLGIAEVAR